METKGRAGGLALFWLGDITVNIKGKDDHFIDFLVSSEESRVWRMTGVYSWPENGQKFRTWEMINLLGRDNVHPWVLGGDFNEVLLDADKRGGVACDFNNMCAFRDCLDVNGLRNMGSSGHAFTWSNRRTEGHIEEKLDRCVSTEEWCDLFQMAVVENIVWDGSDHYPIMLLLRGANEEGIRRNRTEDNRLFRFEATWVHHENFDEKIRNIWDSSKVR